MRMKKLLYITLMLLCLQSIAKDNILSMYPVPVKSDILNVSIPSTAGITLVEIRNLIGKRIQTRTATGATVVTFTNLSELPNGIYMVLAKDSFGKIVESQKLIINK